MLNFQYVEFNRRHLKMAATLIGLRLKHHAASPRG
jgi:hypothetical protein